MSKKVKLGLFGLGVVGRGFYELLEQSTGLNLEVKKVVIKNPGKSRTVDTKIISTSYEYILGDPEIDVVVELIDDSKAAFEILKRSLKNRKPVVTANKKMLAENLYEIYQLQKQYDTPVLYEGAVCGSIPIVRNLEVHYAYDTLKSIEGIFNGSTNYILTKMIEEKKDYADALDQAKKLGFAETDPTLDVKGFDAKYKLAITIAHAFGKFVATDDIINLGIDKISTHDIQFAKQQGFIIKLIAKAEKIGNSIIGLVAPQFLPLDHSLASVKNEFNGVNIVGTSTGLQMLTGKGAGSLPTGLVVLSDVASLSSNFRYSYSKVIADSDTKFASRGLLDVHVSFQGAANILPGDFEEFNGGYQGHDHQFMNGWITIRKLREWAIRDDLSVILNNGSNLRTFESKKVEQFSLV